MSKVQIAEQLKKSQSTEQRLMALREELMFELARSEQEKKQVMNRIKSDLLGLKEAMEKAKSSSEDDIDMTAWDHII